MLIMINMLFRGVTFNLGQNMNSSEMGTRWATTSDLCSHFMEERCRKNLSNWAKLQPDWNSQTKIHSYKSKVTASGLGAPLVIKHLSQEEPRVAQHDQWYWSMVSTICCWWYFLPRFYVAGHLPMNMFPPCNPVCVILFALLSNKMLLCTLL